MCQANGGNGGSTNFDNSLGRNVNGGDGGAIILCNIHCSANGGNGGSFNLAQDGKFGRDGGCGNG
ncbi:MAG TPA: hypothetical protein VEL70_06045, partial [Candidatus Acidoferrum sp.]|nr:hypothetical protein [Candidatus Acidoferrum sp.]